MRLTAWLFLAVAVILGVVLFQVKYRVAGYEAELKSAHRAIRENRDAIKVIYAEWSYLCEPQRLQKLADRFLDLKPIQAQQLVGILEVTKALEDDAATQQPVLLPGGDS